MKNIKSRSRQHCVVLFVCILLFSFPILTLKAASGINVINEEKQESIQIVKVGMVNPTTVEVLLSNSQRMTFDFYGDNIFRLFQDNAGGIIRDPQAKPEAQMLVDNPRKCISSLDVNDNDIVSIKTEKIEIQLDKKTTLMKVINLKTKAIAFETVKPIEFEKDKVVVTIRENADEYFYGGGVQNGRFSHKGKRIAVENQNSWTDGGVASPAPFYWSTQGYGVMWYTFKKGFYDFGAQEKGITSIYHETDYLDVFFMVNEGAVPLLNDFYQLTGNPVLIPKFGFYQGHLNAYNRDYWTEDEKGILFEDGKRYKESSKETEGGIKESLNGELNNYPFSARAVIDRYSNYDMPLGWLLPNDGYGAGYGQTSTLDGNIQNLKSLADYAQNKGVKIGLWTQSALHPKPDVEALLQRDIVKEVRDACVRVLKTDVAWVGPGYSFGLNGITDAAQIMTYYGNNARPFIISLDGWAGTQRYAGIWSGDQTGGQWEYIRFHIPTYIGSGLSGQPNICSDMDGIFGGKNLAVNTRDFQWKTFTPMELNMDGWGSNEKYPHALGEPATSINRWYLKLKSEILPYAYSIAKESVNGLPQIRAMFLEYPNAYTLGKATQYQFMYGPYFLVAPIYQEIKADTLGNDIRNGIYLPEGTWYDYFTGEKYDGNCIINTYASPLWKLPVFVKAGAIIPMVNPNNNLAEIEKTKRIYELYPQGDSSFTEYDDDGETEEYRFGKGVTTVIESSVDKKNKATITIHPAKGEFNGFVKDKSTEFRMNVTEKPKKIEAKVGKNKIKLAEVNSLGDFNKRENVFFYDAAPNLNRFATPGSEFEKEVITKNPQVLVKLESTDITTNAIVLTVENYKFEPANSYLVSTGALSAPVAQITDENTEAYTLNPTWNKVNNANYYEIEFNNMLYSTIQDTELLFDGLEAETAYSFKIRSVNKEGYSDWATFGTSTKSNPLEFAIQGITGETTAENQGRSLHRLFDFEEGELWHTKYGENSIPFDLVMDLKTVNQLDKFHYIPRDNAGNGTILKGAVAYSMDKENWTEVDSITWAKDNEVKIFEFKDKPTARYIKLSVTEGVGGFGSGKEIYVFKVPGTESYIPGDINSDGKIDRNDLTSYTNYTGLRKGDSDFEGYISIGDVNNNDLIDAYDISLVATQLDGGVSKSKIDDLAGTLQFSTSKQNYNEGETIEIQVKGDDLVSVNALSFALTYNPQNYEYVGIEALNMKKMENLTNDRLHTNGVKALYPTFVNIGDQEALGGSEDLFIIKFRAKQKLKFDLKAIDVILVDKDLNTIKF